LSVDVHTDFMTSRIHVETEKLLDEIARYLAAVDVFRGSDCEPTWLPETVCAALAPPAVQPVEHQRSAH
jgi:hypothetical protein